MKKILIFTAVVILLALVLYIGRNKLKSMFSPTTVTTPAAPQALKVPSDNIYLVKTSSAKGKYLTDFAGVTLYIFDKDTALNVSTCDGACAKAWPAYTSGAVAQKQFPTNISVITRTDGSKQFAWMGHPLYYYAGDAKAGDLTGDGIGGIWHIIKQ